MPPNRLTPLAQCAARRANVPPRGSSRRDTDRCEAIRQLEVRQGTLLFQRTTRSVVLTEAGAALFRELRPAVAQITGALSVLDTYRERPAGTLRLTLSRSSMRVWLEPLIAEYRRVCPDVVLDLSLDDGAVDLASGRFDAGIRQGESIEKDMVAVRLTPEMRWAVAGSPAYFKRGGTPATPEDLLGHEGILYRFVTSGQIYRWEFAQDGREFTVEMKGHLIVNDRSAMISLAISALLTCRCTKRKRNSIPESLSLRSRVTFRQAAGRFYISRDDRKRSRSCVS